MTTPQQTVRLVLRKFFTRHETKIRL